MHADKDEIVYEPVPGYRTIFFIIFGVAAGYLAAIFYLSLTGQ